MHLPKLIKKLITFPKLFPRTAHPRQLVLCMLFLIFAGASSGGGLLWADQTLAGPIYLTDGQTYQLTEKTTVTGGNLIVSGTVTIDLKGFTLDLQGLVLGGVTGDGGRYTYLTVKNSSTTASTLKTGYYDVANDADTTLLIAAGVTVDVNGSYYINTNTTGNVGSTRIIEIGTFDTSDGQNGGPGGTYSVDPTTVIVETDTYYWTGTSGTDWTTPGNWSASATESIVPNDYPGEKGSSTAIFSSTASGAMVSNVQVAASSYKLTLKNNSTGDVTIISVGTLGDITLSTGSFAVSSTLTLPGELTVESGAVLSLNSTSTLSGSVTNSGTINATAQITYAGEVINNGTITNDADTNFEGNYSGSGNLLGSTSADLTITFLGNVTFGTFTANGDTVKLAGTTAQTLTTNEQTFSDINFANTGAAVTVSGNLISEGTITNSTTAGLSINGNLTLNSSSNLTNSANLNISGSLVSQSNSTISNNSTINLTATASTNYMSFYSYSGNGTITTAGAGITSNATTAQTLSVVEFTADCAITNSGSAGLVITNLTGASGKTASLVGDSGGITIAGASWNSCNLISSGTVGIGSSSSSNPIADVTVSSGILALNSDLYAAKVSGNLKISGDSNLTITNMTASSVNDISIDSGKSLTLGCDLTVNGNWTNSGSLVAASHTVTFAGGGKTIGGNQTFADVNFTGAGNTVSGNNTFGDATFSANTTLSGTNTFANFTCSTAGTTLTFGANKTQTVTGNFNISGATLISSGRWTITTPAATATISNSTIINSSSTNAYIRATSSTDGGNNSNWNFAGNTYTWNGNAASDKTKWNNAGNWTPKSIPGPDSNATIPGNLTNYPDISSSPAEITNLTLNASSSKIKLSSTNNLKVTGSLTNKGSITFSDSGRIVNTSGTAINDVLNGGTVEYSGGTAGSPLTITDYGDTDYANLSITSGVAVLSSDIKIIGNYTGTGGSLVGSTSSDPTIEFKGNASFGSLTANGDTVKLSGSAAQSLTTNNQTFYNIVFDNSSANGVSVIGNLISEGAVTNNTSAGLSLSGSLTAGINSTITNNYAIKLTSTSSSSSMSFYNYEGNGSITTSGAGITSNAGSATTISSLTASGDCTITNNGSAGMTITSLTGSSGKTINLAGGSSGLTVTSGLWNNCSLTSSGSVNLAASTGTNSLAGLSATSGSLTLNGELYSANLNIATEAEIIAGSNPITVTGNWTNTGSFTCGTSTVNFTGSNSIIAGDQTFYTANFSGNNATITGNNSFTDFTCTTAGVTLTFGAGKTQTVSGSFTITGSSSSKVSLTSSGNWNLDVASANASVSYASIKNSHAANTYLSATNTYLSATNSTDAGGNVNWDFIGNNYTWTGTASSDWNIATNWNPASLPGPSANASIPGGLTTNYPDISSEPILITNLTLSAVTSKITLSGANNLTARGTLTNYGTMTFSSSGRIVNSSSTPINDTTHNGTVEYSGGTAGSPLTITDYGDTDYAKLVISSGVADFSSDILIAETTSIANGASLIGSTSSDPTIEFKGDVTLGTFTANGDTVKLSGSAAQSLTTNNQTFYNIVFENTSDNGVSINGNLTSDGTITNNTKIALANSGTMTFAAYSGSGSISTSGAGITSNAGTATTISSLTASGDCTITNNGSAALSLANLTATSGKTLTLASAGDTAPLTVGNASWNSCNLTITGSGTVALSSSTSTNPLASLSVQSGSLNLPSETYATALANAAGATVTATGPSPLTVAGPLTNAGSLTIASSSTSPIAVNGSLNNSGSLTISDTSANPGNVTITGAITNAGSLTLANTTLTAAASWTNTSTGTLACGTSTVNFTGTGATIAGDQTFYIANFSGQNAMVTGDNTYTRASFSGAGITVSGSNTFAQANFSGNNITLSGDNTFSQASFSGAGITLSGTNTFEAASFTGEGTTLTASNTFKTATFAANTRLSANNTFTTFLCNVPGTRLTFGDGSRQTIQSDGSTQGTFTITGSADEPVILTSQTRGLEQSTWWILDMEIPSNASVQYASISSSYAESDISAMVSNSTEEIEGTTDGWFNVGNIFYWAGNLSSDWSDRLNWSLKRNNLAGRPPALPPSLTDGSSTIIHLAPSTAYNLDYSQIPGQIKLNNLIIETDTLIQKDLTANYILLYGGRTELQAALSATEDLIMLGQNYSCTDQQTGLSNIYTYPGSSTITSLADQNADYSARLFCTAGASLTAKNFYANGITASSSGDWTLKIHSNFNTNQTFAQAFYCDFSDSACKVQSSDAPEDADALKIMAEECSLKEGYTTGWDYEDFIIQQASTCDDNVIKVDFNRAIRNDASTVTNASAEIILTDAQNACSGIFTDQACTSYLPSTDTASSFYSTLYLKSPATWNTDASSLSAGSGTDKSGVNRTISPIIKVDRNTAAKASFITDLYGKRLRHYNAESGEYLPFTNVQDACGPVLLYVLTGQELHSEYDSSLGEASQPYYDAHNFLEFRYSEALSIESWPAGLTENIPVSNALGAVQGSMENSGDLILTLAGLCQIQKGQLYTGRQGQANKYVNAFYFPDSTNTSIFRLSIAGLTDGTIADRSGSPHKNWVGYIEAAVQPSGSVTLTDSIDTSAIKDLAGNNQVSAKISVNVDSTENGIYGSWDLTEPSFTPLMLNISDNWEAGEYYEALGNSISGELYIDEIEFHLFDNMPKYTSEESAVWHTERGWIQRGTNDQLYTDFSYAADIIGGARPFDTDQSRRTSGGIRYSPLAAAAKAFKFTPSQTASAIPDTAFPDLLPYHGAKGTLFTGSSETRRAADRHDGLYFGLELPGKSFSFTDSFTLSYDDTIGFITDLAGNRLRSATIKTIDRTPPSYNLTIGPVNQKELLLLLSKHVVSDIEKIRYIDQSGEKVEISESFESLLPYCFEIINIDSSGNASAHASLQPDTSIPAKVSHITSESDGTEITQIILTMTNDITYKDLCDSYIRLIYPEKYGEFSVDPITGIQNARVTFIQDQLGNFMNMYDAHALSELAVNVISPSYGCTSDSQPAVGWSVHDWNADQQNFGTLPAGHDYDIVASCVDGLEHAILCFSAKPDSSSISTKINSDLNLDYRIWLPSLNGFSFPAFTYTPSSTGSYQTVNASASEGQLIHTIPAQMTAEFSSGSQVSFLYAMADSNYNPLTICNIPTYDIATGLYNTASANRIPLFAVRQLDLSNLLNLDLWSFKIKGLTLQRGGVTIFNNVINVSNGESLTLQVDVAEEGVLNIMIMTLDGNVIDYLAHGKTAAGSYTYTWNGRNKAGNPVARGMYFIRVMGKNFDETRKVMVVK